MPIRGWGWILYKLTGGNLSHSSYALLRKESKEFVDSLTDGEVRALSRMSKRGDFPLGRRRR